MLTRAVESYLAIRRTLGFQLHNEGLFLQSFALFAEAREEQEISTQTAIDWAGLGTSAPQRARRLGIVIRFAQHLHAEDQRQEVPPSGIFGTQARTRPVPYIFSPEQIRQIIGLASRLDEAVILLPHTYSTLFALLACTGLRVSEALKLQWQDVTIDGLVIRESKFRKTRLVPLHTTSEVALSRYLAPRQRRAPAAENHLFVSSEGHPLRYRAVATTFETILKAIGLDSVPGRRRPTLHSLRHTFAVRSLEACSDGRDRITRHTVALSHYLGHYNVAATYWYLEATPNLMNDIAEACDHLVEGATL